MKRRISLFLVLMLSLCLMTQAQEGGKAVIPEDRNIPRFQEEVQWMNAIARNTTDYEIDLLFVGDSITHRWEKAGKNVWKEYYGNRRAFNFGIGGDRTGHVIWRLEHAPLKKISPKMTVVMIGTNNGTKPEETVLGIKKIIDILKTNYPKTKILLLEVFPRGEKANSNSRQRIVEINKGLRKIYANAENVTLMDLSKLFLDKDGSIPKDMMTDFLHPEEEGYKRWAMAIEPEIEKVLGPIPADPPEAQGTPRMLDRFHQKNEILKKGNVDILMIGDSITHGWEDNGKNIWNKIFTGKTAVNLGTGWDRTEDVIWRLEHYDFSKVQPKAAFILIGVNNSGTSTPENIGLGNKKICTILHQKFPNMKIYVQKVFPWGAKDLAGKNDTRQNINTAIVKNVKDLKYVTILDLEKCFLKKDGKLNTEIMTKDLVHLQEPGYENWGKAIQPYLNLVP